MKSKRDAAVGAWGTLLPSPVLLGGKGPAGQNPESVTTAPKRERQKENKQVWSQAHGACLSPALPCRDDGWLQPAGLLARAGPAIYITLAFHRSPLTRHCLGPEAPWPLGSSVSPATRGL